MFPWSRPFRWIKKFVLPRRMRCEFQAEETAEMMVFRQPKWKRDLAMYMGTSPDTESGLMMLSTKMLERHCLILGATGSGKTVYAIHSFFQLVVKGQRGGCFIDPKGDAVDDVLALIAKHIDESQCDAITERIHILELSPESVFSFNPFNYNEDPSLPFEYRKTAYISWLYREVDSIVDLIFQSFQESEAGKPRLKRILRNILIAVGTAVDETGKHLPLAESTVLIDVHHPRHDEVYATVEPYLPTEIRSDFELLHQLANRPADLLGQVESTINRLRSLLTPIIRSVFSKTIETIDFVEVVRGHFILLVNAAENKYVSRQQANVIANLIIHKLIEAAASMPRKERQHFHLHIDEAHFYCGSKVDFLLRMGRGYQIYLTLISQNMESFKLSDDVDYRETVLSEPQTKIVFAQNVIHEDLLLNLAVPNLSFDRHAIEVDRHDGFQWLPSYSVGNSVSEQQAEQRGRSQTRNQGIARSSGQTLSSSNGATVSTASSRSQQVSQQHSQGQAVERKYGQQDSVSRSRTGQYSKNASLGFSSTETVGNNTSVAVSNTSTDSTSSTSAFSDTRSSSNSLRTGTSLRGGGIEYSQGFDSVNNRGSSRTDSVQQGASESTGVSESNSQSESSSESDTFNQGVSQSISMGLTSANSEQWGHALSNSKNLTHGASTGQGKTHTIQQSTQHGAAFSGSTSHSLGSATGDSWSLRTGSSTGQNRSISLSPVANIRTEIQEQPTLRTSVNDQLFMMKQKLMTLQNAEAMVRLYGVKQTMKLKVFHHEPPYSGDEFFEVVEKMRSMIKARHSYNFAPNLSAEETNRRIDKYIECPSTPKGNGNSAFEL